MEHQFSELSDVLTQIILQYIETHKRLVIPQLGAFIVKAPEGEVLFSELFRRDDGVLRGLLYQQGMNELEAAGAIDRLVFEVRHTIQDGGTFRLEGLGSFSAGENGTILFHHEISTPHKQPSSEFHPAQLLGETPTADSAPWVSISPKVQPDPSVKGLRYGRPQKLSMIYRYTNGRTRRRIDRFLIVAIAAAIVAVAAIVYGYMRTTGGNEIPKSEIEQPISATPASPPHSIRRNSAINDRSNDS